MRCLAAIDGSTLANEAVASLAHFAPPEVLTLVHAIDVSHLSHGFLSAGTQAEALREAETALRKKGRDLLANARARLPTDVSRVDERIEVGAPAEVILDLADSTRADLIVLGARGLGPVRELLLGSVSHRVVLHASCSTLVVKGPFRALDHLLVAVQGPDDAERLLGFLESKPFRRLPQVTLMTVCPQPQLPPWPLPLSTSKSLEQEALDKGKQFTDQLVERLSRMGYRAHASVELGTPTAKISEHQQSLHPDLVMLGSHGKHGLSRFLLGSVSNSLLHHITCPVLIVRAI